MEGRRGRWRQRGVKDEVGLAVRAEIFETEFSNAYLHVSKTKCKLINSF